MLCVAGEGLPAPLRLLGLLPPVYALEMTPFPHGLVTMKKGILYSIQEDATALIAMRSESTELVEKMREAVTNYSHILIQKEKSTASANIFWKCVAVLSEQIRSMSAPVHPRKRHGWLNFIGPGAKKPFGIATEDDMKGFRQAVLSNGEAIDKITRQSNRLVGVVNMLGSATKRTMAAINKFLKC